MVFISWRNGYKIREGECNWVILKFNFVLLWATFSGFYFFLTSRSVMTNICLVFSSLTFNTAAFRGLLARGVIHKRLPSSRCSGSKSVLGVDWYGRRFHITLCVHLCASAILSTLCKLDVWPFTRLYVPSFRSKSRLTESKTCRGSVRKIKFGLTAVVLICAL